MSNKHGSTSKLVILPEQLSEQIKAYQEETDILTENEAIRSLIKRGLKASERDEVTLNN